MEDLELTDCKYTYDPYSKYPAYYFKMSTGDMVKFGLLYLQNGNYKGVFNNYTNFLKYILKERSVVLKDNKASPATFFFILIR